MREYPLKITPRYNAGFMCKVCEQTGMGNWQPEDGETYECSRCRTKHTVIIKVRVDKTHTIRRYLRGEPK